METELVDPKKTSIGRISYLKYACMKQLTVQQPCHHMLVVAWDPRYTLLFTEGSQMNRNTLWKSFNLGG